MKIIRSPKKLQSLALRLKKKGCTIGFVPTMGYLHEGHLSLIRKARRENDRVIASLFVNPAQFGPGEDLERYPRDLKRDKTLCEKEKVDWLFVPCARAIYPEGYQTYVEPGPLAEGLCGKSRPGHFRGVLTVVAKLFNLALPDRAYFGQKDYQQALVIRQMAANLDFPLEVKICPTVRAKDGLALSSRNAYLGPEERTRALCIYRSLGQARAMIRNGVRACSTVRSSIRRVLSAGLSGIDYVEIREAANLSPVKRLSGKIIILVAGFVGNVRLIDNCIVSVPEQ